MRTATVGFDEIESKGKIKGFCQIHSWFFEKKKIHSRIYNKINFKSWKAPKMQVNQAQVIFKGGFYQILKSLRNFKIKGASLSW